MTNWYLMPSYLFGLSECCAVFAVELLCDFVADGDHLPYTIWRQCQYISQISLTTLEEIQYQSGGCQWMASCYPAILVCGYSARTIYG